MSTLEKTWDGPMPTKGERLRRLATCLHALPPARTGLEAYAQIANSLNLLEDQLWGKDAFAMPRSYENGVVTQRMYPSHTECFETVAGFGGVTNMVHTKEFILVSATGAIEIQRDTGESEIDVHLSTRTHAVVFAKNDARGRGVWDAVHRDEETKVEVLVDAPRAVVGESGWLPAPLALTG